MALRRKLCNVATRITGDPISPHREIKQRTRWADHDDGELPQVIGSHIFVQVQVVLQGKTQMVEVTSLTTGARIKELVQKKTGVPVAQLGSLYHGGRLVDDTHELVSYGVASGSTIEFKARLRGGTGSASASQPIEREMSVERASPALPHIQQLKQIAGVGPRKRKQLQEVFGTADELRNASEEDLAKLPGIGPKIAKIVHEFLQNGTLPQSKWRGQPRVPMWDKQQKRKLSGALAPVDNEDAINSWLAARETGRYERYHNQDLVRADSLHIPAQKCMSRETYSEYFLMQTDSNSRIRLDKNLHEFGLKWQQVSEDQTSLMQALIAAAYQLNEVASEDRLRDKYQELSGTNCDAQIPASLKAIKMLDAAHAVFKRPVWVWTGHAAEQSVLDVNSEGIEATRVTPLRLAQDGNFFAPAVECNGADNCEPVFYGKDEEEVDDADSKPLQDLKDDIKSQLRQIVNLIRNIIQWSKQKFTEPINLTDFDADCKDLLNRFDNSDGLYAALLSDNGIGKSTLISLLVFLSRVNEATYAEDASNEEYVLEAFSQFDFEEDAVPTLQALLRNNGSIGAGSDDASQPVRVNLIQNESNTDFFRQTHSKIVENLRGYCERKSTPNVKNIVLPCGGDLKTTSVITRVRHGKIMHILVTKFSVHELKMQAFEFVLARKALDDDTAMAGEAESDQLLMKWKHYKRITEGIVSDDELENQCVLDVLPSVRELPNCGQDVRVFPALAALCENLAEVFVCAGKSLLEHQMLVHDQMVKLNHPESLYRIAMKACENFQPAGILENGNGLVDCPGLNDADEFCKQQTMLAVRDAGVLLILLRKSLSEDKNSKEVLESCAAVRALQRERPLKVAFLFYREILPEHDQSNDVGSNKETNSISRLRQSTRNAWLNILKKANKDVNAEDKRSEGELAAIADSTEMRAIYPMIHTSLKLNWEFAETNTAFAERIWSHSNVCWLLGLVDALNRDALVASLEHLVVRRLPEMLEKLQGSLDNASGSKVPDELVQAAQKLLPKQVKSKRAPRDVQAFKTALESLQEKVLTLISAGTSEGTSVRAKIVEQQAEDFITGTDVATMLSRMQNSEEVRLIQLKEKLKRPTTALAAIDPKYKGEYHQARLVPLVLDSKRGQVNVDFATFIGGLSWELNDFKEQIIDLFIGAVDEMFDTRDAAVKNSLSSLRDTFVQNDIQHALEQRCSISKFFTAKQPGRSYLPATLQREDFPSYLQAVVYSSCAKAVHQKILSQYEKCTTAADVLELIRGNLGTARESWKDHARADLQECMDSRIRLLESDLTGKKKAGLIKQLLVAFLQHVLQASTMQQDVSAQSDLQKYMKDIKVNINELYSLYTRSIKQNDPIAYGKAAMRHLEGTMFRLRKHEAKSTITLKDIPMRYMPSIAALPSDMNHSHYVQMSHMFSAGEIDQVRTLSDKLRDEPFRLFRGQLTGHSDLFKAVAHLLWRKRDLLSRMQPTDADESTGGIDAYFRDFVIPQMAKQLRTLTVAEMAEFYVKQARCDKFLQIAGEDVYNYMERVDNTYPGDAHCLWFLARSLQVTFRLWLPGSGTVLVSHKKVNHGKLAHNLILTSDNCTDQPTEPKADHFIPQFYPVVDSRTLRHSDRAEVQYVSTDDDSVEARRSVPFASREELANCPDAQEAYANRCQARSQHC